MNEFLKFFKELTDPITQIKKCDGDKSFIQLSDTALINTCRNFLCQVFL